MLSVCCPDSPHGSLARHAEKREGAKMPTPKRKKTVVEKMHAKFGNPDELLRKASAKPRPLKLSLKTAATAVIFTKKLTGKADFEHRQSRARRGGMCVCGRVGARCSAVLRVRARRQQPRREGRRGDRGGAEDQPHRAHARS